MTERIFEFEIQNCIKVRVTGETAEDSRQYVIEHLEDYADEFMNQECYVSNGKEIPK